MDSGPALGLAVLTAGAVALFLAMAYRIMRNRTRTTAEKRLSEEAAGQEYKAEDVGRS